jgi:hypothetical protein
MTTLRWILGTVAALVGGGFTLLFLASNGLRRSFGASENNPLIAILPLLALGLLLAALVTPTQRTLLHMAAVAAAALAGFSIWMLVRESATVMWLSLVYLALWFGFYWLAAWKPLPLPIR